jgi:hypothetical protein
MDGFWIDGIYDGTEKMSFCSDEVARSELRWSGTSNENFPDDNQGGSLAYRINTDCFSSTTASGYNGFAFVSPPLPNSWNDITGYNFSIMSALAGGDIFRTLSIQPVLEVEKADGREVFLAMADESGDPIFLELPNDGVWHTYTYERQTIDPEDTVIGLTIIVFVPDEAIGAIEYMEEELLESESFIFLDTVVPLRS